MPLLIFEAQVDFIVRLKDILIDELIHRMGWIQQSKDGKLPQGLETGYQTLDYHFRFKLEVDSGSVGNLNINWSGKAEGDSEISLYYWKFFSESKSFGLWAPLKSKQSDGDYVEFSENILEETEPELS